MRHFGFAGLLAGAIVMALAAQVGAQVASPKPAAQVTADEIDAAVAKGLQYLWSKQQPNGLFSPGGEYKIAGQVVYGGDEVMTMTVLAYAGESLTKPEMEKALKALMGLELGLNAAHSPYTYTLGFRLIALAELYRRAPDEKTRTLLRQCMKSDAGKLVELQLAGNGWSYTKPSDVWDFSNTQIAVLGLQQAVSCGIELKSDVLSKALELYLAKQMADGGWGYGRPGDARAASSYGSMTAAGTVSVFLLRDLLNPGSGCPCKGTASSGKHIAKVDEAISRGLKWLDGNFTVLNPKDTTQEYLPFYWLYTVERVSIATGFKYLGSHDWYREGATYIVGHGFRSHQIIFQQAAEIENTFPCWLVTTSEAPHEMTLYLRLHAAARAGEPPHLQADVPKDLWRALSKQPQPWRITLDPARLLLLEG